MLRRRQLVALAEATRCGNCRGVTDTHAFGKDADEPNPDGVARFEAYRKACPNYHKLGHAAFCERCDETPFRMEVGGVYHQHDGRKTELSPTQWPRP